MGTGFQWKGHVHSIGLAKGNRAAVYTGFPALGVRDGEAEVFAVRDGDGPSDAVGGEAYIF